MRSIQAAAAFGVCLFLASPRSTVAQSPAIPPSIATPDKVPSSIGALEYRDASEIELVR